MAEGMDACCFPFFETDLLARQQQKVIFWQNWVSTIHALTLPGPGGPDCLCVAAVFML